MIQKAIDALFSKSAGQLVVFTCGIVWLTVWIGLRVRDVEKSLDVRFTQIEKRVDDSWTVQMMAARDRIVAEWNTTNRIPDAWRIYFDVKAGREPTAIRITP